MSEPERIRITHDDAYSPKVDEVLAREGSFGMRPDQFAPREESRRGGIAGFLYSSIFYTSVAGALGGCLGWAIIEPHFEDRLILRPDAAQFLAGLGLWVCVGGLAGCFIGAVEGLVSRNWGRALISGIIGLAIGAGGSLVLSFVANIIYTAMVLFCVRISGPEITSHLTYTLVTLARAVAWTPMGLAVGLGPAIHMRSK
jgi:hypothetical protein